jgi:hypothetical protein
MLQQAKPDASDANSALAFQLWLARSFRDGSPEEDLFRAMCANSMKLSVIKRRVRDRPNSKHRQRD